MYAFTYERPTTIQDVTRLLAADEDAKLLAGGQTLIPTMKLRLASPGTLIDLGKVEGLTGIKPEGDAIVIGAMTRHADVANSPLVKEAIPGLVELVEVLGDPAVRHLGTIGGSVANNDPNADYPAGCLGLGAIIVTSKRRIGSDQFFKGLFETALEPDEMITAVSFPRVKTAGYVKFRNPASRFALVGVFAAKLPGGPRVAVTGAGASGVFRVPAFEQALAKDFSPAALEGLSVPPAGMSSDIHGSAEYRAHLVGVLARRAVKAALAKG